jgi:uncharacterized protein YfdQ (DUF2303 family)
MDTNFIKNAQPIDAHASRQVNPGSNPFVVLNDKQQVYDLEKTLARPSNIRGTTTLYDEQSFIAYAKAHAAPEQSAVFYKADESSCSVTAVMNAHVAATRDPMWQDFRAEFSPETSAEWRRWIGSHDKWMHQKDFAEFIEANSIDMREPSPAEMIELSRSFEAKKKVDFAQQIRLDNSAIELQYEEKIDATAAKGKLKVPQSFKIGVPVFTNGPLYEVEAMLRYDIRDAKLTIKYQLVRKHKIVEHAVGEIITRIKDALQLPLYRGETKSLR